ncbi:uncharacterized protein SPSC_04423 [Sporisorium scitamineum]|uniref:Wbp11/ELF5/Saf1 N-terminal domain-containing protein n=1 Tax=Sporisorium scitamineum TaxID=49012 RepID=A0A0F7RVL7_9BASI|nr:uncharacterized protein SPSC_04423 [Sporisorium scitamineum]CDS00966.1 hypothetical protein [Sporisorium scitamineum]
MAKSSDPVQAARKAAIKREAKRNRERKQQAHEARALRQDTSPLEQQIQRLESRQATLDPEDQEELKRLQKEVADVKRIKQEYIRKHPDQRNFVRGYEEASSSSATAKARHGNNNDSIPSASVASPSSNGQGTAPQPTSRDPRWSIYYDAVFNPYGAPPPGMPYLEKPHVQLVQEGLLDAAKPPPPPEETENLHGFATDDDSDDSSVDEDLKDIIMPSDPPPIRLVPEAARPSHQSDPAQVPRPTTRGRYTHGRGGRGRGSGPTHHHGGRHGPGFAQGGGPPQGPAGLPQRPPAGLPVRPSAPMATASTSQSQSQSSSAATGAPRPPGPPPAVPDGVVISAEPQLRDFKKESTAFVPAAIRKKQQEEKARMKRGLPGRVDAAPISSNMPDSSLASHKVKPDLLKSVQAHLPSKDAGSHSRGGDKAGGNGSNKDYDRFLDEIGDLL